MKDMPSIQLDLECVGAKVELISSHGKWQMTKDIYRLYRKYNPIVVHTHFVNLVKIITLLFSCMWGSTHFTSFHSMLSGYSATEYRQIKSRAKLFMLRSYYKLLALMSKNIFTVSGMIENQFIEYYGKRSDNLVKFYLGVDNKRVAYNETLYKDLNLPSDKVLLLNISAIERIKGLDILLRAVSVLKNKRPELKFKMVHIGGLRSENKDNQQYAQSLIDMSAKLGVTEDVKWLGLRDDVVKLVPLFDIYVHPSRQEGLPTTLVESANESLPLIGSNIGGIPEIVHHNVNGFLFDSEDADQLADYMAQLIEDKVLRSKMGQASLNIVEQYFDADKQTDTLISYYFD